MGEYTRVVAMAKRLIEKKGRSVSVIKDGTTVPDPTKPWRVSDTETKVTGKAVMVDPSTMGLMTSLSDGLKDADAVFLFAASNDSGNDLEQYDKILDGTKRWGINTTKLLNPGDERILYVFGASR